MPPTIDNLAPYVDDVYRAAEIYYLKGISVKLGIEIGWHNGCEEEVQKLCDRYQFDYILCGIHEIENICFCCRSTFKKCFGRFPMEKVIELYFKAVNDAAASELFDCIAHLGYYLKYGQMYYGEKIITAHKPYLDETLNNLKSTGTGLEINTAAIRHGLTDYYPTIEIINKAKKAGVDIIHLGSDAHKPEQVGYDFEMAASLVPANVHGSED